MSLQPTVPLWPLLIGTALAVLVGCLSARKAVRHRMTLILLRTGSLLLIAFILLNPQTQISRSLPSLAKPRILLDVSASMQAFRRDLFANEAAATLQAASTPKNAPEIHRFSDRLHGSENGARTQLGTSLLQSLEEISPLETNALFLISDGCTEDEALVHKAIALAQEKRIPIHVLPPPKDAPVNFALSHLRFLPQPRGASQEIQISVRVQSSDRSPLPVGMRVGVYTSSGEQLASISAEGLPGRDLPVTLKANPGSGEPLEVRLLQPSPDSIPADDSIPLQLGARDPAKPLRVLYLEGTPWVDVLEQDTVVKMMPIAWEKAGMQVDCWFASLQANMGGNLEHVSSLGPQGAPIQFDNQRLPLNRDFWSSFDLFVISDINRGIITTEMQQWVRQAVLEEGAGFVMIGGNTSFDVGGWHQSVWEQIIPVAMREAGQGHIWTRVDPSIPEEAQSHPIWQMHPDPELNRLILASHPPFAGYHRILRAKPGASTLMYTATGERLPLIAVQDYGKGRSMAFLSDSAGGWGQFYELWGTRSLKSLPPDTPGLASSAARAAIAELTASGSADSKRIYYERFWQNTARWLTAKRTPLGETADIRLSRNLQNSLLNVQALLPKNAKAPKVHFFNQTLPLHAETSPQRFSGNLELPDQLPDASPLPLRVDFESGAVGMAVGSAELSNEFLACTVNRPLLAQIAAATGGRLLENKEAIAELAQASLAQGAQTISRSHPLWNHPLLWLVLLIFLATEWSLRRTASPQSR